MAELLDGCIKKIEKYNSGSMNNRVDPLDIELRLYHSCEYFSYDLEKGLSIKLNQLFKDGQMQGNGREGGLAEKVFQFKEIYFSAGGGSRTLRGRICGEKRRFNRDISEYELKSYKDYLLLRDGMNNTFNQLDDLIL